MDIRIEKDHFNEESVFDTYAKEKLDGFFEKYPFVQSVQLYLRGAKHPTKKVKMKLRVKGKDIFADAKGTTHHDALENVLLKLRSQMQKHKTKRYRAA